MTAVDFSDADEHGCLAREPLNVEINVLIERAATTELPRGFLGASIVGHHCPRQIQFDWWCKPLLADRVRLIFERGHFFEAQARKRLVAAGFMFAPPEALAFVALDGFLQGHADGVVTAGPAMPGTYLPFPCVWECKALNTKNFRAVARDGLGKAFPRYVVQVGLYQHFLGVLNPALFTCVNADSCELLHFTLPYDAAATSSWIGRAAEVIAATRKGELLPRFTTNSDDWRCRICGHRERCWRSS
jgi:hypothetical protein